MSQKTKNILLQALPVITIATLLVVALISAWQEPTAPPPGGNVPAPLNIGPVTQWKSGALGLGYSTPPFTLGSGEIAATTFRDANNSAYFIDPSGSISAILSGNVGIGTTTPAAKLDVAGAIKIGTQATCNANMEGVVRYNFTSKALEMCNGISWVGFGDMRKSVYDPNDDGIIDPQSIGIFKRYVISNDLLHSHDAQGYVYKNAPYKVKTITLTVLSPSPITIRVKFEMMRYLQYTVYGRIYKNGVAFGTLWSRTAAEGWGIFSEDLQFAQGDALQLYIWGDNINTECFYRNLRIYGLEQQMSLQDALTTQNIGESDPFVGTNN